MKGEPAEKETDYPEPHMVGRIDFLQRNSPGLPDRRLARADKDPF